MIDDARTTGQYGFPFSRVSIPLRGTATKATGQRKHKTTTPKSGGTGSTGTVTAPSAGGKTAPARPGPLVTGVADDYGKYSADGGASFFSTLRSAGMSTNRMTVLWQPGQTTVSATDAAFLDRSIAEQGRYPAVNPLASVSRLAGKAWRDDERMLTMRLKAMIARYEDTRDIRLLGGYQAGTDAELDLAIRQVPAIYEALAQSPGDPVSAEPFADLARHLRSREEAA